jgi:hypothetical protein
VFTTEGHLMFLPHALLDKKRVAFDRICAKHKENPFEIRNGPPIDPDWIPKLHSFVGLDSSSSNNLLTEMDHTNLIQVMYAIFVMIFRGFMRLFLLNPIIDLIFNLTFTP